MGMKELYNVLLQEPNNNNIAHAKKMVEAGIVEAIVSAMDKPPFNKESSKLQAYGWELISRIDYQTTVTNNNRERIINACLSLSPELQLLLAAAATTHSSSRDHFASLQSRINRIIQVSRNEATKKKQQQKKKKQSGSSKYYYYRELRDSMHGKIRLLLYRHRRRQDRIEMQVKLGPYFEVKTCTGGFLVSLINDNSESNAEMERESGDGEDNDDEMEEESRYVDEANNSNNGEPEVEDPGEEESMGRDSLEDIIRKDINETHDDKIGKKLPFWLKQDSDTPVFLTLLGPTLYQAFHGMFSPALKDIALDMIYEAIPDDKECTNK